jgi:diguanylate cyclase (GGDEF)-like protein
MFAGGSSRGAVSFPTGERADTAHKLADSLSKSQNPIDSQAIFPQQRAAGAILSAPSWEALRGYSTLLRGVLDAMPYGVAVLDRAGTLTIWNQELASMLPTAPTRGGHHDLATLVREVSRIVAEPEVFEARLRDASEGPADAEGAQFASEFEVTLRDGGALAITTNQLARGDGTTVVCFRDATGELRARRELEHRAMHDTLTGLPNRELLMDRLTVALARLGRQGTAVGVLFIDLDGFKEVNDVHGHQVGDELLVSVAGRLRREIRDGDTVARYGGDEFVVLCEDLQRIEAAAPLAQRLADAVAQPVSTGERLLVVQASIGVVVEQNPATSAEMLVKRADAEMYRVKQRPH